MIFSLDDVIETAEKDVKQYSDEKMPLSYGVAYLSHRYFPCFVDYSSLRRTLRDPYQRNLPNVLNNFPLQQIRRMPFSSGLLGMWWGNNEIQIADHLYGEAQWEVEIHERQHQVNPHNAEQENRNVVKSILPFTPVFH